jgi:hypothetical protein
MKMMHIKLPLFILKLKEIALSYGKRNPLLIKGLENLHHAQLQSLRTGRIESAIKELAEDGAIERVELSVMPRVPETMHTVIVKGIDKNGANVRAILEVINILHPTEDMELADCPHIDDRRPTLGNH